MKVRLTCFYGDAVPGDVIAVSAAEHDRLVALGSGVSAPDAAPPRDAGADAPGKKTKRDAGADAPGAETQDAGA
ncbi:MAG: hypothetical protein LCH38_10835 [Proteobacteria bacterium]|nr:hypothetical protein [Pseudomonadota bacterium]